MYAPVYINKYIYTQLVKKQTPDGYEPVDEKLLQFKTGRFESALEIHIDKLKAEGCGWVVTMESERKVIHCI